MGRRESSNSWVECADLISETNFAQDHTSAWRSLAPTTDLFVRRLNLQMCTRQFAPLVSSIAANRRAFINEIAFENFSRQVAGEGERSFFQRTPSVEAVTSARTTIARLEKLTPQGIEDPNDQENDECMKLFHRLLHFFRQVSKGKTLELAPRFSGCGIIDTCSGDVYCDRTLYEVKAGQRSFRSVDVRQLLLYAALNKAANERPLERVSLFNPRTGLSFSIGLNELCLEVAGLAAQEFLIELIRLISSGDVSR
jgi:hypothetical protein